MAKEEKLTDDNIDKFLKEKESSLMELKTEVKVDDKSMVKDIGNELIEIGQLLLIILISIAVAVSVTWVIKKILNKFGIKNKKLDIALAAIIGFITFSVLKKVSEDEEIQDLSKTIFDGANDVVHGDDKDLIDALKNINNKKKE